MERTPRDLGIPDDLLRAYCRNHHLGYFPHIETDQGRIVVGILHGVKEVRGHVDPDRIKKWDAAGRPSANDSLTSAAL